MTRKDAMNISGSAAQVTGANRGLGLAFTRELVRRGQRHCAGLTASRGASGGGQRVSLWAAAVKTTRSSDVGDVDFSISPPQAMHLVCNRAR